MSWNSSTSSFELTGEEYIRPRAVPWAALAFLAVVALTEAVLEIHHIWFCDRASWQWETKYDLIDKRLLDGDVAVVGSSILFHGFDPTIANEELDHKAKVVNLALNGQNLQHATQLLHRFLEKNQKPNLVLLELWHLQVEHESWLRGPYFRFSASWADFLQSKSYYWEPSLLVAFAANRFLPSFRYHEGLRNWLSNTIRAATMDKEVLHRNETVTEEMIDRFGFSRASFENDLLAPDKVPAPENRPWQMDRSGEIWLNRFLEICNHAGIRVVLVVPPAPSFVEEDRIRCHFYEDFSQCVKNLRKTYPDLSIETLSFTNYELKDFSDDHHLSCYGCERLSHDLANWLKANYAKNQ
jgi:hypothetical protein